MQLCLLRLQLLSPENFVFTKMEWWCSQTQHEGRLYTVRIHCGEDYPDRCPSVRFVSKLNMGCVDQRSGEVLRNKLQILAQWNRNYGIEQVSRNNEHHRGYVVARTVLYCARHAQFKR